MKPIKALTILLLLVLGFSMFAFLEAHADWAEFHHDRQHTGFTYSFGATSASVLWNLTIDNTHTRALYSPVVSSGRVYTGSPSGTIYCVSLTSRAIIWSFQSGAAIVSCPAVGEGFVYVGSDDDYLYCLSAENGSQMWSFRTGGEVESSPTLTEGQIYFSSNDGNLYCLDSITGAETWSSHIATNGMCSPAVSDGRVYISGDYIWCLNATTGDVIWRYTSKPASGNASPTVVNGQVYVGFGVEAQGAEICFNASTGDTLWSFVPGSGNNAVCSTAAYADGMIYFGCCNDQLYCLNATTGAMLWGYRAGSYEIRSSPAVSQGLLYFEDDNLDGVDGKVYCLNASSGAEIWNYTTGTMGGWSSPAIGEGLLVIGAGDYLYAFGQETRTLVVPDDYPTIQQAINAASDGDTIFVRNGTYYENVVVNKTLTFVGENKCATIVDGKSGWSPVFNVTAGKVTISGFTVQNAFEGISLTNSGNNVTDNIVMNSVLAGIYLEGSSDNIIADNQITNTSGQAWWSGMGIFCNAFSSYNTISNNTLDGSNWGIGFTTSEYNTLRGNRILNSTFGFTVEHFFDEDIDTSNLIDGRPIYYLQNQKNLLIDNLTYPNVGYLGIVDSANITVRDIDLHNNGEGILLANTNNSVIENLRIENNRIGIHLSYSMNNTINSNEVSYNKLAGIYLEECDGNTVKCNMISYNFFGLGMTFDDENNTFYHDSFVNNEAQIDYRISGPPNAENIWAIGCEGNYWSDYNGTIFDINGIGTAPYVINANNTDNFPLMNVYWNLCDINHDLKVDMRDLGMSARAFHTVPGDLLWNPHADITGPLGVPDGKVDMRDIGLVARHFGEHL